MKIIRGNTLPDYTLLSQKASLSAVDGYLRQDAWMYKPIAGVNIEEVTGEESTTASDITEQKEE